MLFFGTSYLSVKNLTSSLFAFPFSGGAEISIFHVPSSMIPCMAVCSAFGLTFTVNKCGMFLDNTINLSK